MRLTGLQMLLKIGWCVGILASAALAGGCRTWRGSVTENGLNIRDVSCAHTFFVGEPAHPGMPLLPMSPDSVKIVRKKISRAIPELHSAPTPETSDLIISVLTVPKHICTHCEPEAAVKWSAVIEKGGASHRQTYAGMGPFLALEGEVLFGTDALEAFVSQLRDLVRRASCENSKLSP